MPCCIAILDYAECRHRTLYKLGCTAGCEELCAPAQQEVLLGTRFRWRCEECHTLRYAADADARTESWSARARDILEGDHGSDHGHHDDGEGEVDDMRMLALRGREEFEEQLHEERRVAQVEEIQYAEEWTVQYGRAVFALHYGPKARRVRRRQRRWWRRREEEQRSEEDDDEAEQRLQQELGSTDDETDDDEQQEAAQRQVERLRSLQLPDLVVVRDALRSDKELREQRDETQRMLGGGHGDKCGG